MELMEGEKVLIQHGNLLLTSHRVRYHEARKRFTSIMLEEVCSVEGKRQPFRWLLLLGVAALVLGIVIGYFASKMDRNDPPIRFEAQSRATDAWALLALGVGLLVSYHFVGQKSLVIRSAGAAIEYPLTIFGGPEFVSHFADKLEAAKD